jgi:hypothetical protein
VGFVVDKKALGRAFSEYFGFPCEFSFHPLRHSLIIYYRRYVASILVASLDNKLKETNGLKALFLQG